MRALKYARVGLECEGAARRTNGMQSWFGRLPGRGLWGRKISEGAALRGFAGFQKVDAFAGETPPEGAARPPAASGLPSIARRSGKHLFPKHERRGRRPCARAKRRDREILLKKEKMP